MLELENPEILDLEEVKFIETTSLLHVVGGDKINLEYIMIEGYNFDLNRELISFDDCVTINLENIDFENLEASNVISVTDSDSFEMKNVNFTNLFNYGSAIDIYTG